MQLRPFLLLSVLLAFVAGTHSGFAGNSPDRSRISPDASAALPRLWFESVPGAGVFARGADYSARVRGDGLDLALGAGESVTPVRLLFVGARADGAPAVGVRAPGVSHFLVGRDRSAWRRGVAHWAEARVPDLYPGISARWHGRGGNLEFDLRIAPGADPGDVRMRFEGAAFAPAASGDLVAALPGGEARLSAPVAWQETAAGRRPVEVAFSRGPDGTFGFAVGARDPRLPLVVDPEIAWRTTASAGVGTTQTTGVSVAADGSCFVSGRSMTAWAASLGSFQVAFAGGIMDATLAKVDADGVLLWSTYLGGAGYDLGYQPAADPAGTATIYGWTNSADFPVRNALDGTLGLGDYFVARVAADGTDLVWSTYLGGSSGEGSSYDPQGLAVDASGAVIVAGKTSSTDFPTADAIQGTPGGTGDAFVVRIAPDGQSLEWGTYLGGTDADAADAVGLAPDGSVIVGGTTKSRDFPTVGAFEGPGLLGGTYGWGARIAADGSAVEWASYLGGQIGWVLGAGADSAGAAYFSGMSFTSDFPVKNAFQPEPAGAFVLKVLPDGSDTEWATFVGNPGYALYAYGFAVGPDDCAVVGGIYAGGSYRADPETMVPYVDPLPETDDAGASGYLVKYSPDGQEVLFGTRMVGVCYGIDVAADGALYVTDGAGPVRIEFPPPPPPPATFTLAVGHGVLGDSSRSGRDRIRAEGTLDGGGTPLAGLIDPVAEDVTVSLGGPVGAVSVTIGAGDPGWKSRNGKWIWKSLKGASPSWTVVLDLAKGRFSFAVSRMNWEVLPEGGLVRVTLEAGEEFAFDEDVWDRAGRNLVLE